MDKFDTYQKRIVVRSGLAQSTIAGYLAGTRKPDNPELVHRVVRGLLPDDADAVLAEQTLHDGLTAAGFSAPPISPAAALIREKAASHEEFRPTVEQMEALITDLERYTEMRLQITAEQSREKQKQEVS